MVPQTKSVRVGQTVFFKHKYLTQPTVTASDAILRASDDLCQALRKVVPEKGETRSAIDHLMKIFKDEAKKAETPTDVQRVLQQTTQAQRVQTDEAELNKEWIRINPDQGSNDKTATAIPTTS